MIIKGIDLIHAFEVVNKLIENSDEYSDILSYLKDNQNTSIIEEKHGEYYDLINKCEFINDIIRIHRGSSYEDYIIKKDESDNYSLYNSNTGDEWGLSEETPEKLITLLKEDMKDGLCDNFEIIKKS